MPRLRQKEKASPNPSEGGELGEALEITALKKRLIT